MQCSVSCGTTTTCSRVGKVDDEKWESQLSDTSLVVRDKALVERLERPSDGTAFQFERLGFYAVDPDATTDRLVFNLTVPLKSGAPVKKEAGVSRKAQQEADRLKKEALKKVKPQDPFRTDEYQWDTRIGIPTHNKGWSLCPSPLIKRKLKERAKQKKLCESAPNKA